VLFKKRITNNNSSSFPPVVTLQFIYNLIHSTIIIFKNICIISILILFLFHLFIYLHFPFLGNFKKFIYNELISNNYNKYKKI